MTSPTQSRTHRPDPDTVAVREVDDDSADDGLFRIRMPVTSTAEARDGEAFDREKVAGIAEQIDGGRVPVFLDHGRNEQTGHRYSALGKVGYLDAPELVERDAATDVDADFVVADPQELDADVGEMREALQWIRTQARLGVPIASSIGWSEDTGERDLPGDVDLLEASIVGIPSDARTSTTSAEPASLARAVSAASSDFDVATFVRELERQEGVDTVHEPEYDAAANPDDVSWDGLDLEDFDGDVTPQDPVVYNKFLHSDTGFPPAEDAEFNSLSFEVVDVDGTLLLQALEDALDALPAGDLTDEEREAMQEIIVGLAAAEFPDADLASVTAGDLKPASPTQVDGDDDDERATYSVEGTTIDITPPEPVRNAAAAAEQAENEGLVPTDCGTGVGDKRAEQILNDEVGPEVIDEIAAYLTSHEEDVTAVGPPTDWEESDWADCGNAQYAKWGGTGTGTGRQWAQEHANEVADAKGEEIPYPERRQNMSETDTTQSGDDPDDTNADESDGMDAAEFRESMLELQEKQMETLGRVADAVRESDEDDDEDENEGESDDDDMASDDDDEENNEAAADADEGDGRTVELNGETRDVESALADLREQAADDDLDTADPKTQDRADDDAADDTDATSPDWRA